LCDDLLSPEVRQCSRSIFQEKGLALVARPPGMYAERVNAASRPAAGVQCRPIEDERTRLDFAHISSVVFALPFVSAKRIYGEPALWQRPLKGWIGYINNKAVSVVSIVIAADAIGVYSLGTLPQHQGCGYGETLFRHAMEEARKETGITRSILQSTDDGFNLYLRMGYRVVTNFSVYTKETCG
jgi:ribosomal protein S18 acetylase RimI-like enzyme